MNNSALMAAVCFSLGLFALGGCGDTAAGETLDVVAEPSSQPRNIRGGEKYTFNPRVIYQGSKDLGYEWSLVSADGFISMEDVNTKTGAITCDDLGTYKVKFRVYESAGSISATDTATYVVTEFAPLEVAVLASTTAVSYTFGTTGTSTLTANLNGGNKPYNVAWSVSGANGGVTASLSAPNGPSNQSTSSGTVTFSGGAVGATASFIVTLRITDESGTVSTSNTTIIVSVAAAG